MKIKRTNITADRDITLIGKRFRCGDNAEPFDSVKSAELALSRQSKHRILWNIATTNTMKDKEIQNMAIREVVIRIPEDKYDRLIQQMKLDRNFRECEITELGEHGDLIDRQALIDNGMEKGFCDWYDEIKYADTIIKAHHPVPVKEKSKNVPKVKTKP